VKKYKNNIKNINEGNNFVNNFNKLCLGQHSSAHKGREERHLKAFDALKTHRRKVASKKQNVLNDEQIYSI
jgi:hypothetical protein